MSVLFIQWGLAATTLGGSSAAAGWWLAIVGVFGVIITARDLAQHRSRR